MICFHNINEPNVYLSNWYMSEFEVDGIVFNCMEQYMMYAKASLFEDKSIAERIMFSSNPGEIKALGRRVSGFNSNVWDSRKEELVYRGLYAKFSQNPLLKSKLLQTGDDILAECAVNDRIWGIGLSMHDTRRYEVSKWPGQNLLGELLMQVRSDLKEAVV